MSQNTTNILLFPGTDALEDPKVRQAVWKIPQVKAKILETEKILNKCGLDDCDFERFMSGAEVDIENFFKHLIFTSLAVQVAIFEDYEKQGLPCDCLMGISLGDIARDISARLGPYETAVISLLKFAFLMTMGEDFTKISSTHFLKIPKPLSEYGATLQLEKYNLEVSVHQNDYFFLLAGLNKDFESWNKEVGIPLGLDLKFMYPFALHCDLMAGVALDLKEYVYEVVNFDTMKYPIFSCILKDFLTNEAELKEEINLNIVKPIKFVDSVKAVLTKFEHIKFINIGPSPSLLYFINKMELEESNFEMEDYYKNWIEEQNRIHNI